jgi:hypothetical protein
VYQHTVLPNAIDWDAAERQRKLAKAYRLLISLARKTRDLEQTATDEASEVPNQQAEPA